MNFPNSNADLQKGLVEQLDDAPSQTDRKVLLLDLLDEYLQRFMAFVNLHPDELQDLHDGAFWRMVVVASDQLDEEIRTNRVELPDGATKEAMKFIVSARSLNQKPWSAADRAGLDALTEVMAHLRQVALQGAQP